MKGYSGIRAEVSCISEDYPAILTEVSRINEALAGILAKVSRIGKTLTEVYQEFWAEKENEAVSKATTY